MSKENIKTEEKEKFVSVLHVCDKQYVQPYASFAADMRKVMTPETFEDLEKRRQEREETRKSVDVLTQQQR